MNDVGYGYDGDDGGREKKEKRYQVINSPQKLPPSHLNDCCSIVVAHSRLSVYIHCDNFSLPCYAVTLLFGSI